MAGAADWRRAGHGWMCIETEREFYVGALVHHRIVNNNDPVPSVLVTAREFDLVDQALATMQQ